MIPTLPSYTKAYERLNPEQRSAVDAIEGPVMVVAGPGTGKTQVLAARIAAILLNTDTKPYNILALTFTESAAKNMRERVVEMIGKTGYYVQINTFHSFCSEVISSHPEYFPIDRGSEPLTDLERYDLFQNIILELDLEAVRPMGKKLFYIKEIMNGISNLKREGFSPAEFEDVLASERDVLDKEREELKKVELRKREKNLAKQQELAKIYYEYEKRLRSALRYDFEDMIALVAAAFEENELLLLEYQERLHYFLVDEYQDTNAAQNKVVDMLAGYWGPKANVFVVGDPHQAIYRFQGASVENMLGFISKYEEAKVITLRTGYRCPQTIYSAAWQSIGHNELTSAEAFKIADHREVMETALNHKLESAKGKGDDIQLLKAPSQTLEIVYIAEEISRLIETGVPPEEIAILYRFNRDAAEIQEVLEKWGIAYDIEGGINILDTEAIRQLLELFKLILQTRHAREDINLYEVMCYEWLGLDRVSVMKLARAAGKNRSGILEMIEAGYESYSQNDDCPRLEKNEFARLTTFINQLYEWSSQDSQLVFPRWFELVINESGFMDWVLDSKVKIELLNNLNSLYREVKALSGSNRSLQLRDFLEAIEVMIEHDIALQAEDLNASEGAVRLSTIHKAKGQEWEYVYMIHCIDGRWGNNRKRELLPLPEGLITNTDLSKKEQNEDERRLFYVALTRAKKAAHISYPETIISNNRSKEVIGSMFITEIEDMVAPVGEDETSKFVSQSESYLTKLLSPAQLSPVTPSQEEFFSNLVSDMTLSVTALNNYLKDPVEFVTNNLLRVPRAKAVPMSFGTAVHKAMEEYYNFYMEKGEQMALGQLQEIFSEALRKELLEEADFSERLRFGHKILAAYHRQVPLEKTQTLFIERFFGHGFSRTVLDDIVLTGRIDRVDWIDKKERTVRLIDYKTGKPKSDNVIEGKSGTADLSERELALPESIRGPYKRQLLFYKLLTDLDASFLPTATHGVFDFIEPRETSGTMVQRHFELKQEDVNDLKDLIREIMTEIRSLEFLDLLDS